MSTLNLTGYASSFAEEFANLDNVTPWGPSKWICHTPWHGDFGDSKFTDIDTASPHVFPFEVINGVVKISMTKGTDGKWRSGLLCTVDDKKNGFQQAGGYFSCRMRIPDVDGTWPAFWLGSMDYADGLQHEVDVIEYYGHDNAGYYINAHIWDKNAGKPHEFHQQVKIAVTPGSLSAGYHVFGVMVLPGELVFYLENTEVARMTVPATFYTKKMFPMVNFAAGGGWPITNLQDCYMVVDYIHAYQKV